MEGFNRKTKNTIKRKTKKDKEKRKKELFGKHTKKHVRKTKVK